MDEPFAGDLIQTLDQHLIGCFRLVRLFGFQRRLKLFGKGLQLRGHL